MTKERRAATNTGFASGGVMCKLGTLCFYSSAVLVDSFVLRNPPERKARKRYVQLLITTIMKDLIITDEFKKPEMYFIARLPITTGVKETLLLKLSDVNFIEADGSYSKIFETNNSKPYHVSKNIGFYEKILPTHSFLRIHNRFIVNLNQIQYIKRENHWHVQLHDKSVLKLSDEKREILLQKLGLKTEPFDDLGEI
jgi:DNA-binding LytR/AlgR family response regulator